MEDWKIEDLEVGIFSEPETPYGHARMTKEEYISWMRKKTKQASVEVINWMEREGKSPALNVIRYQLIKSATSTGANYRAACIARSKKEFFAKISIVCEECDETLFWLEVLHDSDLPLNRERLTRIGKEFREIYKLVSKARKTAHG